MPSQAERIYDAARILVDDEASKVLDSVEHLKLKGHSDRDVPAAPEGEISDWDEFERPTGAWSGKLDREFCYDRPILL